MASPAVASALTARDLPRVPDSEFPLRWQRLQAAMAGTGLDLVLTYSDDHAVAGPGHARYLADFAPHFEPVCILVPASGEPLLLSGPETETFARLTARVKDVRVVREFTHPDEEYPFTLTTGRIMFHYHTGSMTRRSEKLEQEVPEGYVEISPEDANRLGLGKSEQVRVVSRRGEIETRAWITRRVPPGTVFIPFHFAEAAANLLTNPALDPVAKIPEYKVAAVRIDKIA